nr:MAG TPA: hypothetical protein [Caudoviricetes sp.]
MAKMGKFKAVTATVKTHSHLKASHNLVLALQHIL